WHRCGPSAAWAGVEAALERVRSRIAEGGSRTSACEEPHRWGWQAALGVEGTLMRLRHRLDAGGKHH
ncbi:MAG: hypothetical protein ACYC42_08685, partial [Lysobacter sp.]